MNPAASEGGDGELHKSARKRGFRSIFTSAVKECMIADTDLFQQILSIEKKRSERSGKPFMLVVLRSSNMLRIGGGALREIQHAILSAVRDTDVVGWHEKKEGELGIIFTEISDSTQRVATAILKRITEALSNGTSRRHAANLDISCHIFRDSASQVDSFDTRLIYPDSVPSTPATASAGD